MLKRSLSNEEARYALLWGVQYKYPLDLVVYACIITMKRTGNGVCPYADAVLRNLKENGFESLEDIKERKSGNRKIMSDIRNAK